MKPGVVAVMRAFIRLVPRTNFQNTLAQPTGSIHWAGTETSDVWYGYIEGAVRAGERAANEILKGGV